jgi:hypothetical protein
MIHAIGNSHANMFNNWPNFWVHWIGPTIAYNFYEHHLPHVIEYLEGKRGDKGPVPKGDTVMFVVGEVDCRWHLPKQAALQNRSIEDLTKECVSRYFRSLKHVQDMGYNIIAWGAHPSTTGPHNDDPQNPVYGDCITRNKIAVQYNRWLKELSESNNMKYVSIFDYLIDENLVTKMEYFIDYCHLDGGKVKEFALEEFRKNNI